MKNQASFRQTGATYQDLAKLLGIDYDLLKESNEEPKWRKLEILNELKALNSKMHDFE